MTDLLGRRLDEVLPLLKQQGIEPVIVYTTAPGKEERDGSLRVIRVKGNELTVACFPDGMPE
ncbi:MAG: hypothetical protein MJ142_07955 [Clostridia bacterium]|nr:hypothetical protein [Clostridia bacterium]